MAWNDSEWGNSDWGRTDWHDTGWGNTDWGRTDWHDTDWGNNVQYPQGDMARGQLMKVTLGVKIPDGSCIMVVTWARTSGEAISAFAKNCQGCIINELVNSDAPGAGAENAGSFCQ